MEQFECVEVFENNKYIGHTLRRRCKNVGEKDPKGRHEDANLVAWAMNFNLREQRYQN